MKTADSFEIGLDYAHTLSLWRERFEAATDRLEELGYDERFRRMWILYLAFAEGGFRSKRNSDFQMLLAKPGFTRTGVRTEAQAQRAGV